MPDLTSALASLSALDGVDDAVAQAREACTELRWHNALRRRTAEAAAESRVRGARASAAIEGAERPVELVRDVMRGAAVADPADPVQKVVDSAIRATAETERLRSLIGMAPGQVLARLHVAAMSGLLPDDQVGRPRIDGENCRELSDLGPAPSAAQAAARLRQVQSLLTSRPDVPQVLLAAVVHAEIATARPFVSGNGIVARALERTMLIAGGVDPTGVCVPEVGHLREGATAYGGALAAYATGSRDGVRVWLVQALGAVTAGAGEGQRIADAVLAGRITR